MVSLIMFFDETFFDLLYLKLAKSNNLQAIY